MNLNEPNTLTALATQVAQIARAAGADILEIYSEGASAVTIKGDDSPLTQADLRAHHRIVERLEMLSPQLPILSEESAQILFDERRGWSRYWLVDPLDGTKEFLSRNGEFTVNIALVSAHSPVLGVVYAPVPDTMYLGIVGAGAWCQRTGEPMRAISAQPRAAHPIRVVGSKSHRGASLDHYLDRLGPHTLVPVGSSLKLCMVAEGAADLYPRLGPTSEWDTAAGHAVVLAAGGHVVTRAGLPLEYNCKADLINPDFLVYADISQDWLAPLSSQEVA